jgi:hypothetical protein
MDRAFTQWGGFVSVSQNVRGRWPFARIRVEPRRIRVRCFTRKVGTLDFGADVKIRRLEGLFWRLTEGTKDVIYYGGTAPSDADRKASEVANALVRSGFTFEEVAGASEADWGTPTASEGRQARRD